jgi:hypothetical protein
MGRRLGVAFPLVWLALSGGLGGRPVLGELWNVRVTVKDSAGQPVASARVAVLNPAAQSEQDYPVGQDGTVTLIARSATLRVSAPGFEPQEASLFPKQKVATFALRAQGQAVSLPPLVLVPVPAAVTPPQPAPAPASRVFSVVIESEEGQRVKDAEVTVVDAKSGEIHSRKLLGDGIGTMDIKAAASVRLEIVATAPGMEKATAPVGDKTSYVVKLQPKKVTSNVQVTVKDAVGRKVGGASVLASEGNRELTRGETDDQGSIQLSFTYASASDLTLEVYRGGYQTRKVPVSLPRDKSVEVVLLPTRPAVKSTLAVVVVLSKVFSASPKTYAQVRESVNRILSDCQQNQELWSEVGLFALGDEKVRDILPLAKELDAGQLQRAKKTLSDLYGGAGSLSWRDLTSLSEYLSKLLRTADAGCDVLVIAPKNMSLDDALSLYDAGGEPVLTAFRSKNLRLRLIEVGAIDDVGRAYRELAEGTQGFYKALRAGDALPQEIGRLQFHFPNPPPIHGPGKGGK